MAKTRFSFKIGVVIRLIFGAFVPQSSFSETVFFFEDGTFLAPGSNWLYAQKNLFLRWWWALLSSLWQHKEDEPNTLAWVGDE